MSAQTEDRGVPVGVAQVVARVANTKIELSGTVLPWATSHLAAEVDGRVEQLFFKEGQYVKEGTLLVQLHTYPLELERDLARAEKKLVAARLEELQAGSRRETIAAAKAALEEAKARLEMARTELGRIEKLYRQGVLSVHDYDNRKALADAAQAQFEEKKAYLEEVVAGPRIEKIRQEEASLLAAEGRIKIIEDRIYRASIFAPFPGYVVKKETEVGQWLEKGDLALTMVVVNPLKVEVHLPQYYFNKVKIGTPAEIKLGSEGSDASNETFHGKVIEKIVLGDAVSRTFPVRVKVNHAHTKMAPGMLVRVELHPKSKNKKSLYVPKDAVVRTPREAVVWMARAENDKTMRAVKVVVKTGKQVESLIAVKPIKQKIKAGEWVIVQGNERLRPGMKVDIKKKF